jgi:hypothetical protein
MKVILTEKQYEKLKGEMEEALGVPEGILEVGEEIYDLIIKNLEEFEGDIDDLNQDGIEFEHTFKVGDHYFYRVKLNFQIEEHEEAKKVDMVGMSSENEAELDDRFVLQSRRDPDEIIIGFKFFIESGQGVEDIVDYIKKYRKEDIPSLTHEIKHAFRDVKQKGDKPRDRSIYVATQMIRETFGYVPALNEFLFNSYFIHVIENVVRPTEMAAEMRINNVSQKEFLNFFLNTEMIRRLKQIQNFSYTEFKEKLKTKDIDRIKKLLDAIDSDYDGKSDEEIVNEFLKLFLVNLTNSKNEVMKEILTNNMFEKMFGLRGDKDQFFRKFVSYTTKFGYDYDAFFESEEKYFHRVANQMIKKLAKLYAMAKKDSE